MNIAERLAALQPATKQRREPVQRAPMKKLTVYMPGEVHAVFTRIIEVEQSVEPKTSGHDMLIAAVDMLFESRGLPRWDEIVKSYNQDGR